MKTPPDIERISQSEDIRVHHVGLRDGSARILLARTGEDTPTWSIDLHEIRSLYHVPACHVAATVDFKPVGSFGWWLREKTSYTQVEIRGKHSDEAIILAIAGSVACRVCDTEGRDLNYPG